jgi:translation initiation factor 2 beta subunit (eIF-2beta)/eIF-5
MAKRPAFVIYSHRFETPCLYDSEGMPNSVPKRGTMREEDPTPNNTAGPETKKVSLEKINKRLIRNSLFDILSRFPHDYRRDGEKEVHSYLCRRCALTVRLNGLRNQILTLVRDVKETIGEMQDD